MPANDRWGLIRRLKVNISQNDDVPFAYQLRFYLRVMLYIYIYIYIYIIYIYIYIPVTQSLYPKNGKTD